MNPTVPANELVRLAWRINGSVTRRNLQIVSSLEIEEVFVSYEAEESDLLHFSKLSAGVEAKRVFFGRIRDMKEDLIKLWDLPRNGIKTLFNSKLRRSVKNFLDTVDSLVENHYDTPVVDIVEGKFPYISVTELGNVEPKTSYPVLAKGVKLYTVNTCYGKDGIKFGEHEIVGHRVYTSLGPVSVTYETSSGQSFEPARINSDRGSGMLYEQVFDTREAAEAYARECAQTIYAAVKPWL